MWFKLLKERESEIKALRTGKTLQFVYLFLQQLKYFNPCHFTIIVITFANFIQTLLIDSVMVSPCYQFPTQFLLHNVKKTFTA